MKQIIAVILAGAIATPALAEPATQAGAASPTTIVVPVGSAIVNTTVTTTKETPVDTAVPERRGKARSMHKRAATRHHIHAHGSKVSQNAILRANPAQEAKWRNRAKSDVKFGDIKPTKTTTTTTTVVPAVAIVPAMIINPVVTPKSR